ncbi:DUF6264 family protein [Microbacterium sp. CFH 31415]|uniref:DUF6264 family protein n=1 Tax=Microbacterium sp. CFH 31415 TaxID=2921732 RepID=UPI001F13A187|nr:DUF6264 family protein [Microbacterium sp. CFH 31415]MCH6232223.1 DUF6264 family protein [Microbacterium sp. CFH 31415]
MTEAGDAVPAPEPRPRPQFGEYATPEEQRARIAQPDASLVYEPAPVAESAPVVATQPAGAPAATARTRTRPVDRIVTFALLAYGLINVIATFPALADFSDYAQRMFDLLGVDATLTDPAAGRPWGVAAAIVLAVGWLITAALSWVSVRRGRLSWWIPLVGGVVFTFASASLVLVPLMNDPAVWEAMVGSLR